MATLQSKINIRSEDYAANKAHMDEQIDDLHRVLAEIPDDVTVRWLDFHAEATSDMQLMGRYLDGRVSAVLGTHTHVSTADEQLLPGGTAFQCDIGMTGPHASILGRRIDRVLETTLTFNPTHFEVATEDVQLHATLVEVKLESGFLHQIRATMAHLGHPVLGDREYFGEATPPSFDVPRQMLHSTRIGMDAIFAEVQPPADFEEVLEALAASED